MTFATPEQLQAYAATLVRELRGGDALLLHGELGSGKTTFVQGLANAFGITNPVRSPTFIIRQDFAIKNHPTISRLVHIDLYRLGPHADLTTIDLDEAIQDPHTLTVVEWPERTQQTIWPKNRTTIIRFTHGKNSAERAIAITRPQRPA